MSQPNYNNTKGDFEWFLEFMKEQKRRDRAAELIIRAYEDFSMAGNTTGFNSYLEEEFGIKLSQHPTYINKTAVSNGYEVIDEAKHTLFLLKYS